MTLEILISTYRPEGIERVAAQQLPRLTGVSYLVSWQEHGGAPVPASLAKREDVRIVRFDGKGQSANRNNAFDHASGDILLVADDDLTFHPQGLQKVMEVFEKDPELEMGIFKYDSPQQKFYPEGEVPLIPGVKGWNISCVEIALRRESRAGKLRFDLRFGINAPVLSCAEDDVFVMEARRAGVNGRFFPVVIATHPAISTGFRTEYKPRNIMSSGAYHRLAYKGLEAELRIILKAWRLRKSHGFPFWKTYADLKRGARYIKASEKGKISE